MEDASLRTLPLNKMDVLPKNRLDRNLFVFMTLVIPLFFIWESTVIFRYHHELNVTVYIHLASEILIFFNVIGNLYYLKRVDSSCAQGSLPIILRPSWRYCHFCQLNAPPRSYHCPICDKCILRRDQHCMFTGCCVGYQNHRYYLMAVVYIMIGSAYAAIYQWSHTLETIGGVQLVSILSLAAPHIAVLFGFLSIYGFIVAVTQVLLFVIAILLSYIVAVQVICISKGQTIHEKKADIALYDLGWRKNFVQILGKKWYVAILCPFVSSPVSGDGLSFPTFYDLEEVKNV